MHFFTMLILGLSAFATSKIKNPGQPIQSFCEIRAVYEGPSFQKVSRAMPNETREGNWVYWDLEIKEVSNRDNCPTDKKISLRLRSANYRQEGEKRVVTYPSDFDEPVKGDTIKLTAFYSQGKDTYLQKDFAEWTLGEVLSND